MSFDEAHRVQLLDYQRNEIIEHHVQTVLGVDV